MSILNDYAVKVIADQRQREFQAEAANARLARMAAGERQVWWRRLGRAFAPAVATSPEATPATSSATVDRATVAVATTPDIEQSRPVDLREKQLVSH